MCALYEQCYAIDGMDFDRAGEASTEIKSILKGLGLDATLIRRIAIATFEGEMNIVIHAVEGFIDLQIWPDTVQVICRDKGKGIPDIERAMTEGFSTAPPEAREMGFGAGMGLPNMKRNADTFDLESVVGVGTIVRMGFRHGAP